MIKMPQNWNEVKEFSDRAKLPLGAYVCQTKQCRVIDTDYGSQLVILFDICEGEYKGFYAADYAGNETAYTYTVQNDVTPPVLSASYEENSDGTFTVTVSPLR